METCNAMRSARYTINERIAAEVFETLPECAPLMAILDAEGHWWPSDAEALERLNLSDETLADLRAKVDDGAEPAATQLGETAVTMMQLATEQTNCGYLLLAVPRCGSDGASLILDMAEVLASVIALTGRLIEKDRGLSESQLSSLYAYRGAHALTN